MPPRRSRRSSPACWGFRALPLTSRCATGCLAYTVGNVHTVLEGVGAPLAPSVPLLATWSGFDVMAGYLAFDALILNKDRHARNWAVLRPRRGGQGRLCGLYDNASSLGLSLGEARVTRILDGGGADAYVRRESAARAFAKRDGRDSTLLEVAVDALRLCSPGAHEHWLERVGSTTARDVVAIVDSVPDLSEGLRTLVPQLVMSARRGILGAF